MLLIAGVTIWPVMAKLMPPPAPSPYGKEKVKPDPNSPPIPESELTHIIIPKSWLINNDQDKRPEIIKIAIPKSWLNNPPKVDENKPVVLLRIPKMMLYDLNSIFNKDRNPNVIVVSLPKYAFKFYPNITMLKEDLERMIKVNEQMIKKSNNSNIVKPDYTILWDEFYGEWVWFQRYPSYNVIYITGIVDPVINQNSGTVFWSYHEREIYLDGDGDVLEVISDHRANGEVHVWVSIFDNNVWEKWDEGEPALNVSDALQPVEYYVSIKYSGQLGKYAVFLHDTKNDIWKYGIYYDTDNPSTRINWLTGSTELLFNYPLKDFYVKTYPIRTDWTLDDNGNWHRPKETFTFYGYSSDQPHVNVYGWWDTYDRLVTSHSAYDENY